MKMQFVTAWSILSGFLRSTIIRYRIKKAGQIQV